MTGTTIHIPTLETERLRLRAPGPADFEAFAAFRGSARARTVGGPYSREEAFEQLGALIGQWHLRGFGRWIVADKASDEGLGVVGMFYPQGWPAPEIAWSVFEPAEGKGIAYEAALAARRHAYAALGWTSAISLVAPENHRSVALAKRLGARIDGRHEHPLHGRLDIWRHPGPEASA